MKFAAHTGRYSAGGAEPATEEVAGKISLGSAKDVDRAVAAARRASPSYSEASRGIMHMNISAHVLARGSKISWVTVD